MAEGKSESGVYSMKQMKNLLRDRYGDDMYISEVCGRKNIVCFRNVALIIVNKKWYDDRKEDMTEESYRIVSAAAKLIKAEIHQCNYSTTTYPSGNDINNPDIGRSWISPLLLELLKNLISDELKQLSIGNAITQATMPRSVIAPLLFGLGVELNMKYRSKFLINQLSRLGFSITYEEIVRFKQSAVVHQSNHIDNATNQSVGFTQWVADNVDHSTITIDGRGSFHGMGIIAATTSSQNPTD